MERSRTGLKISFDEEDNAYVDDDAGHFMCDECFCKYDEMRHTIATDKKLSDSEKDTRRRAAAKELIRYGSAFVPVTRCP